MQLVMKSIEMVACEGRQLSCDDFDRMEYYATAFRRDDLKEDELCQLLTELQKDYARHLEGDEIEIDIRGVI